jgi:hypothetical protein
MGCETRLVPGVLPGEMIARRTTKRGVAQVLGMSSGQIIGMDSAAPAGLG